MAVHRYFVLRFAALILSLLPLFSARGAETLRLGADQWMPFNGDPAGEQPGYVVEMARKIFARHGITVEYKVTPWGDALAAAAKGELDGVIGANRTEAAQLFLPEESVGEPRVALWVRKKEGWRYSNLRSLLQVRVGVVADYKYWDSFDEFITKQPDLKLTKFSGDNPLHDALAQLRDGKIDALPETLPVFTWNAKVAGVNVADFTMAYLHEGEPVYLAFSPKKERAKELAKIWDDGVREMRKSGELAKIVARYSQRDWK